MQDCAQNCHECAEVCLETVTYCLEKGGEHARADHIRLLLDCAEICDTSHNFIARDSELHGSVCAVCAEVCERCAQSCEMMGEDEQMKKCAEACRRCADSCRQMGSAA
ncbi:MAG TPA: four-helix bundle copper-binding protein [Candidatus Thermoplasmatota archaeon]|nr:four-helix bundle copper-binding protein [Candidatus Thermoplasmatota archaeon]